MAVNAITDYELNRETKMRLTGLHLLITYRCTQECDHCFLWGSPRQSGAMSSGIIRHILAEAESLGTVAWIYFEGGEPFLYRNRLLEGVRRAAGMGFRVGIVTNAYWAKDLKNAVESLDPFAGLVQDLSISSDFYHREEQPGKLAANALEAAKRLGIRADTISVARPFDAMERLSECESAVMYRGRAMERLAMGVPLHPWTEFTQCPHEDLDEPERLHVDCFGNLHICQGISVGNLLRSSLSRICKSFDPDLHPIIGPLHSGGPVKLVRYYGLSHSEAYADACHLCYEARGLLREGFPQILGPDQMYGVAGRQPRNQPS